MLCLASAFAAACEGEDDSPASLSDTGRDVTSLQGGDVTGGRGSSDASGIPRTEGGTASGIAPTAGGKADGGIPPTAGGTEGGADRAMGGALSTPGPEDGEPGQPVVAAAGVPCGPHPSLFGLTSTNVKIGGRDVHVAYPCNKRKGAPVTFILNLHGTMPVEALKLYQVAYFSANTMVNSHNLIVASPKSVVAQWGNGDGGADEPHLKAVIDWVYTTFKDFDIRAMWVGGHSWGAMYTSTFACKQELADKVKGAIIMSGFPTMPACSSRISVINTNAENDLAGPLPQGKIPMQHGCGAAEMKTLGNNTQTLWPNCQGGFVHSNYLMLGKQHADYIDAQVIKSIADLIKQSRQ